MGDRTVIVTGVGLIGAIIAFIIFTGWCYIGNIVKLAQCDWKAEGSWKGEIIHAVGLLPPAAYVTYWFDDK